MTGKREKFVPNFAVGQNATLHTAHHLEWKHSRRRIEVNGLVAFLVAIGLMGPVSAESCSKSRDYILEGFAGDLSGPAARYRDLFKVCLETLTLANVRDAYLLKDGGIAIVPSRDSVFATAEVLAQFCQRFPKRIARFLTSREQSSFVSVGRVVMMTSSTVTSCKEIRGVTE
ncbi:MAG TPA: hypothetical protein VH558_11805 [Pseudolabrys sp.]|jgi:hypothetical protein